MQGKNIESLSELVSIIGSNFNILEEEIDIEVQKDYILLAHKIKQDPEFSTKQQKYFHDTAVLFDENTPDEEKKYALIALAQIAEPAVYVGSHRPATIPHLAKYKPIGQSGRVHFYRIRRARHVNALFRCDILQHTGSHCPLPAGLGDKRNGTRHQESRRQSGTTRF